MMTVSKQSRFVPPRAAAVIIFFFKKKRRNNGLTASSCDVIFRVRIRRSRRWRRILLFIRANLRAHATHSSLDREASTNQLDHQHPVMQTVIIRSQIMDAAPAATEETPMRSGDEGQPNCSSQREKKLLGAPAAAHGTKAVRVTGTPCMAVAACMHSSSRGAGQAEPNRKRPSEFRPTRAGRGRWIARSRPGARQRSGAGRVVVT